jgi:hypothetical protein
MFAGLELNKEEYSKNQIIQHQYLSQTATNINASVFRNYLKTYHNVNSGVDIPYTAILIKAVVNWAKSKIPCHLISRKFFSKNV